VFEEAQEGDVKVGMIEASIVEAEVIDIAK